MLWRTKTNAKNDIMSIWQLETGLYRHGNLVIFRGTKRDKKSHIYKSSAISVKQRTLYKVQEV